MGRLLVMECAWNACLSGMLVADCVRSTRLTKIARERLTGSGMRVERLPVRNTCGGLCVERLLVADRS